MIIISCQLQTTTPTERIELGGSYFVRKQQRTALIRRRRLTSVFFFFLSSPVAWPSFCGRYYYLRAVTSIEAQANYEQSPMINDIQMLAVSLASVSLPVGRSACLPAVRSAA